MSTTFSSYLKFTRHIDGGRVYPRDGWTQGWLLDPYAPSKVGIRGAIFTPDTPGEELRSSSARTKMEGSGGRDSSCYMIGEMTSITAVAPAI